MSIPMNTAGRLQQVVRISSRRRVLQLGRQFATTQHQAKEQASQDAVPNMRMAPRPGKIIFTIIICN